jgi:hypothetical protein
MSGGRVHGLNGFHDFDVALARRHLHTHTFWMAANKQINGGIRNAKIFDGQFL